VRVDVELVGDLSGGEKLPDWWHAPTLRPVQEWCQLPVHVRCVD
jgi:hypothetical protein